MDYLRIQQPKIHQKLLPVSKKISKIDVSIKKNPKFFIHNKKPLTDITNKNINSLPYREDLWRENSVIKIKSNTKLDNSLKLPQATTLLEMKKSSAEIISSQNISKSLQNRSSHLIRFEKTKDDSIELLNNMKKPEMTLNYVSILLMLILTERV